ncbi:Nucleoside-diphosphate-sugar epimerase [Desulfomicrobium apsheronum]|uniref:Nucleoside-diphosphate-sugar epimerase n=1 Tax=Desulfomicrobium apsheronum TaxID=52560 RepID=A0A1I3N9Q6_9BACT|nr:NAD-dependent epimerase/dehydratase family protein [Desulfomicrobium apsheronum]SFJ05927.1 Nucleoside-diphosphate-sugar epimerase [Desulfomicrobium apsheronum]
MSASFPKRALVTGASGFIGRALCLELTNRDWDVAAMLRRPQTGPWGHVLECDLGRDEIDPQNLDGVDTIFHLAGKAHTRARNAAEKAEYEAVHVHGTRSLLRAARQAGVRACVLLSSVKAMGEGGVEAWDESTPCSPQNPYGITKLAAERIVLEELPLSCSVVLRPTLVYGAGSKGNLDLMIRAVQKGVFPSVAFPANGRSMIHVQDVVQACLLAATNPAACGQVYVLTDGNEYSTKEMLAWIHEALGKKNGLFLPFGALEVLAALGDIAERFGIRSPFNRDRLDKLAGSARYSNAKICRELEFAPSWDLRRGINEMVEGLRRK